MTKQLNEKVKMALEAINNGEYEFKGGLLYKGGKALKGSIGSEDGQKWYSIKNKSVQGQKLAYAYYHGFEALDPAKMIKHLDGDKLNNRKENLVQVSKKGWKAELEKARIGLSCPLSTTPQATTETTNYNDKQLQARNIMLDILVGKLTMKEIAEKHGVKPQKVYDIKKGKSSSKATADLRAQLA